MCQVLDSRVGFYDHAVLIVETDVAGATLLGGVGSERTQVWAVTWQVIELLQPWLEEWGRRHPRGTRPPRLFTVGRLDVQSVGLLFVTNDGAATYATPPFAACFRD